jgi:hypothetical protein
MAAATVFESNKQNVAAVVGENTAQGDGVFGIGHGAGRGVVGTSVQQNGVTGISTSGTGVWGTSQTQFGVFGESKDVGGNGVLGQNLSAGRGVFGISTGGDAVFGQATSNGRGVVGTSDTHTGVEGNSDSGTGVWATSTNGEAVHAITGSGALAAVAAFNTNPSGTGAAIFAQKVGNVGDAGFFDGTVHVTKTLTVDLDAVVNGSLRARVDVVLGNADCAEDFTVQNAAEVEPGTVMVLTEAGTLGPAAMAYDTRVAGVISGAGTYRPAIILDRVEQARDRLPIALVGKVWCKAVADAAPIDIGDLLTTSAMPGHAMRASDRDRAFGAVLGKALGRLPSGRGLIPILVCLQ